MDKSKCNFIQICIYIIFVIFYTGPINREMRNLITSLKNHNEQLKGEVARYKRKLKDCQQEIAKVKLRFVFFAI